METEDPASFLVMQFPGAAPRFFSDENRVAIRGLDPIAYFKHGEPRYGSPEFVSEYLGYFFHHISAENLDLFSSNPQKYAPQFGGYCAFAMSKGAVASTVPPAWNVEDAVSALPEVKILGDLLYLNYSLPVREAWRADIEGNITRANGYWPEALVRYGPPRS